MSNINKESYISKPTYVVVSRPFAVTPNIRGYVINETSDWMLLHCFHDFTPDGYSIISSNQTMAIRHDSKEKFFHDILATEDLLGGLETWQDLRLDDLTQTCLVLQEKNMLVTVECETESGDDDEYDIGVIRSVSKLELILMPFDTEGRWQSEIAINLKRVTRIQFGTPYLLIYARYLEGELPKDDHEPVG